MPNIPPPITKAPEISVASGGSAIAFLTGILLLAGERARTRRS
ncbi:VPEID-CTERM sorting domain-containing protein [Methyloglobulus morosus]